MANILNKGKMESLNKIRKHGSYISLSPERMTPAKASMKENLIHSKLFLKRMKESTLLNPPEA
jgi:hypothetical protein